MEGNLRPMDAITLLKQDHKTVNGLFRQFEKLGDNATASKRKVVDQIVKELSIHARSRRTSSTPRSRASPTSCATTCSRRSKSTTW